jgi:hypothetical protein
MSLAERRHLLSPVLLLNTHVAFSTVCFVLKFKNLKRQIVSDTTVEKRKCNIKPERFVVIPLRPGPENRMPQKNQQVRSSVQKLGVQIGQPALGACDMTVPNLFRLCKMPPFIVRKRKSFSGALGKGVGFQTLKDLQRNRKQNRTGTRPVVFARSNSRFMKEVPPVCSCTAVICAWGLKP